MQLKPMDRPELISIVAGWMAKKENYQWLDFGDGKQLVSPEWLKIMTQRPNHVLRIYTADDCDKPIGVVGLSNVNRNFRTATLWGVLGDKSYARYGYTTLALSKILTLGFQHIGLGTINTWIVDSNCSFRIAERLNFKLIGRQRQCHHIDGRPYDRLWFDLLACEHQEIGDVGNNHRRESDCKVLC